MNRKELIVNQHYIDGGSKWLTYWEEYLSRPKSSHFTSLEELGFTRFAPAETILKDFSIGLRYYRSNIDVVELGDPETVYLRLDWNVFSACRLDSYIFSLLDQKSPSELRKKYHITVPALRTMKKEIPSKYLYIYRYLTIKNCEKRGYTFHWSSDFSASRLWATAPGDLILASPETTCFDYSIYGYYKLRDWCRLVEDQFPYRCREMLIDIFQSLTEFFDCAPDFSSNFYSIITIDQKKLAFNLVVNKNDHPRLYHDCHEIATGLLGSHPGLFLLPNLIDRLSKQFTKANWSIMSTDPKTGSVKITNNVDHICIYESTVDSIANLIYRLTLDYAGLSYIRNMRKFTPDNYINSLNQS